LLLIRSLVPYAYCTAIGFSQVFMALWWYVYYKNQHS